MKSSLKKLGRRLRGIPSDQSSPQKFFTAIYKRKFWKGEHSRSGTGSEGKFAEQKIDLLNGIIDNYGITSLLDLGCGDFYWMRKVVPRLDAYHGVDVVVDAIQANTEAYGSNKVSFQCLDLSSRDGQKKLAVDNADLVVCFDILGHMLNEEIDHLLDFVLYHFKTRYLLLTNRRDEKSELYLERPKSRHEGINIQQHPLFIKHQLAPVWKRKAEFPGDFFELYDIHAIRKV